MAVAVAVAVVEAEVMADEMIYIMWAILRDFWARFMTYMADLIFFLLSTSLGVSVSRFVYNMAAETADKSFFLMGTNLGDSLTYYINQITFNFTYKTRRSRIVAADSRIYKYGRWHELPVELMEMILHHSDVTDRVCMSKTCKSWESVLKRQDIRVPPQFPWLLLPSAPKYCKNLTFYDMSHGRIHDVKLPRIIYGGRCVGSSKGWLVMVSEESVLLTQAQISIFNPISGACHKLPSMKTLPCFRDNLFKSFRACPVNFVSDLIGRIELSSEDPSNCIVATIIYSTSHVLAFCRVGGESWGIYEDSIEDNLVDIMFSNNEILYVLKWTDQESVATYSFRPTDYQISLKIIPLSSSDPKFNVNVDDEDFSITTTSSSTFRLAESSNGQLLLIRKLIDTIETMIVDEEDADACDEVAVSNGDDVIGDDNEDPDAIYDINEENEDDHNEIDIQVEEDNTSILKYCRTRRFDIYMLDPDSGTSCLTKLTSLGSQILLFSMSGLSLVEVRDFTGFQENCIYFLEDYCNDDCEYSPVVSRESGIFYLDDERIERSFPSVKLPVRSHWGWFTPNPLNQFNV